MFFSKEPLKKVKQETAEATFALLDKYAEFLAEQFCALENEYKSFRTSFDRLQALNHRRRNGEVLEAHETAELELFRDLIRKHAEYKSPSGPFFCYTHWNNFFQTRVFKAISGESKIVDHLLIHSKLSEVLDDKNQNSFLSSVFGGFLKYCSDDSKNTYLPELKELHKDYQAALSDEEELIRGREFWLDLLKELTYAILLVACCAAPPALTLLFVANPSMLLMVTIGLLSAVTAFAVSYFTDSYITPWVEKEIQKETTLTVEEHEECHPEKQESFFRNADKLKGSMESFEYREDEGFKDWYLTP